MNISSEVLLLLCGIGAIQSFFLAVYILSHRDRSSSGIFLALLFLVLAVRVSKSILWSFWPETPIWVLNVGFAAHMAAGPLFLLYLLTELRNIDPRNYFHWLHLLPAGVLLYSGFSLDGFWYRGGYTFLLYYSLLYILTGIGFLSVARRNVRVKSIDFTWCFTLSAGVFLLNFTYFSNYILGLTSYMLGPMLYSVIIYGLSFYGLRKQGLFLGKETKKKYKNINLTADDTGRYLSKVWSAMKDKPYLDNDFNLESLSGSTGIPRHILSHLFSEKIKQSFPDFINSYRVNEAKLRLKDPEYDHLTIASVAYDCGFNSLSSFNAAFRKFEQKTPSEYRVGVFA